MSKRRRNGTQGTRRSKMKAAKWRERRGDRADAVVQPKEKILRDEAGEARAVVQLRALALQAMSRDAMRMAGLDIAIREGLTRQRAAALVARHIGGARSAISLRSFSQTILPERGSIRTKLPLAPWANR